MDDHTAAADQGHTVNVIKSETGVLIQTSSSGAIHLSAAEAGQLADALAQMAEETWDAYQAQAKAVGEATSDDAEVDKAAKAAQAANAALARAQVAAANRQKAGAPEPASVAAKGADVLPPSPDAPPNVQRPWSVATPAAEEAGESTAVETAEAGG